MAALNLLMMRRALVVLALLVATAGCRNQTREGALADLDSGRVRGEVNGEVLVFRGIPYAAAPVGDLRWRAPQSVRPWAGVRDARSFGAACPQPQRRDRPGRVGPTDESCLFLNVWAPAAARGSEAGSGMPVMVWIHGGAFRIGSGSQPAYDGGSFAANGVILVTFNYRLGRLGFFAHPALEEGGNFGLMDQVAALEWVQRNIAAFGGDPDRVTVFGESAGGASVLHLLTSPRTEGLFAGAAIQSGGGLQVDGHLTETRGGRPSLLAEGVAWQGADVSAVALRRLSVAEVLGGDGLDGGIGAVGPVIDGTWVVDDPGARLLAGEFQRVPVLVGSNSHEASVLSAFGSSGEAAVAAAGVDPSGLAGLYNGDGWQAQAWGDGAFVAGARFTARQVAQAGQDAYLYHFDYVLERRRGKVPGAGHGLEIPFVFNTLDALPMSKMLVTDADRAMARRLHSHWLSFARSGDPAGKVEGYWPPYTSDNDTLLWIGTTVHAEAGFRRDQLDFHVARWRLRQGRL